MLCSVKEFAMKSYDRREWLKLVGRGSLGLATLSSLQLAMLPRALAAGRAAPTGYKALVCVFLYGGNDSLNMLIPQGGVSLTDYQAARQSLAVNNALPITPKTAVADGLALHPGLASIKPLFEEGRLALIGGVGSLQRPVTKAEYKAGKAIVPANLFSHNDQQATWMRGGEKLKADSGWAARLQELFYDVPDFAGNISLAGTNLWQRSSMSAPFSMSAAGVPALTVTKGTNSTARYLQSIQQRLFAGHTDPLAMQYATQHSQAQLRSEIINAGLTQARPLQTEFDPTNPLAQQLAMVAKLISIQSVLGVGRQVFFVGMGGFDTHDTQNETQPALLGMLANALQSFYQATVELGVSQQVTSFTMSDFGRTLSSNGDGTDHGWAGNQLVLGGAVNGGDWYGALLPQRLGSDVDVGAGRLIPALANCQYFAALAQWFGCSPSDLPLIFPELTAFNSALPQLLRSS